MDQKKQYDIALMRYSAISPIISGPQENYASNISPQPQLKDGTGITAGEDLMHLSRKAALMRDGQGSLMMTYRSRSGI